MKHIPLLLVLAVAACSETSSSSGFRTFTGELVNPVSQSVFEVIPRPASYPSQFWCGAGEYARRELGAASNDSVYVVSEAGPAVTYNSNSAVQFSLLPPGQAQGAQGHRGNWGPKIGDSRFVADASRRCNSNIDRFVP
ncbi:hypothetical protein CLV88_10477 [Shimia abyssi]|uniref:Uncharacterized protein n=1 Tax=Shimia abyssi TaxID=1662395 RepID=A0A2P8FEC5_9RHOB|nr:hypothetical protein CLV88_10477 [Shimia abyssi]